LAGSGVEGVGGEAVNGFRGHADQFAGAQAAGEEARFREMPRRMRAVGWREAGR